jgi:hypothetical protein
MHSTIEIVLSITASLICAAGLRIPQGKWVVDNKSNLTSKLSSEKKTNPTNPIQLPNCWSEKRKKI